MLYGEGATGVVCAVLEHCIVALQISSNDYGNFPTMSTDSLYRGMFS